jgi:regulator of sigma E protease
MLTSVGQSLITIVVFVAILGGLILLHEIGHFVTGRLAHIRILEFGIGFPPRAKVLRRSGETLYTLNWLPVGGFVKFEGEDGDAASDPRSFSRARLPIRLLVLIAGAGMNLLVAFAIFASLAIAGDPAVGIAFGQVSTDSPASSAGLVAGDTVASVDGRRYSAFDSVFGSPSPLDDLRARAGRTVTLGIIHADGGTQDVNVTLRTPTANQGALGISKLSSQQVGTISYSIGDAFSLGATRTVKAFGLILGGLGDLGRSIVTDPTIAPPAAGPVGIAVEVGNVLWGVGPLYVLFLAAMLSANLALVNILPFPPLDGGRVLVTLIKSVAGERISVRAEQLTYLVGFVALFTFLIWITVFDVGRLVGGS